MVGGQVVGGQLIQGIHVHAGAQGGAPVATLVKSVSAPTASVTLPAAAINVSVPGG